MSSKYNFPIIYNRIHETKKQAVQTIIKAFNEEQGKFDSIGTYYAGDNGKEIYIEFETAHLALSYFGVLKICDTFPTQMTAVKSSSVMMKGKVQFIYGNNKAYDEILAIHDTKTEMLLVIANEGERVIGEDAEKFMQGASWILLGSNDGDIKALFSSDDLDQFDKTIQPYIDAAFDIIAPATA